MTRLTVTGNADITALAVTGPAPCAVVGQVELSGRTASFEATCATFDVDVRTSSGAAFKGTVTPRVVVGPTSASCGGGRSEVEIAVALN